jgi:MFS transporter, putative metabolite transport protein
MSAFVGTKSNALLSSFAAAFAKIGAVSTAFLFPILLKDLGARMLLYILVGTSLLGAAATWVFRIETTGIDLELSGRSRRSG